MMRCPDQEELQRYADGELGEPKRARVAEHVKSCQVCAGEIERLQRVGQLVSAAIKKETERHDLSGLWEKVHAGISSPAEQVKVWEWVVGFLWKPAARVAYAALLVLVGGFLAARSFLPGGGQPETLARAQVDSVSSYSPEVTVSVMVPHGDKSAIVWISGLDASEEN